MTTPAHPEPPPVLVQFLGRTAQVVHLRDPDKGLRFKPKQIRKMPPRDFFDLAGADFVRVLTRTEARSKFQLPKGFDLAPFTVQHEKRQIVPLIHSTWLALIKAGKRSVTPEASE